MASISRGEPQSVPDPDAEPYERVMAAQREINRHAEALISRVSRTDLDDVETYLRRPPGDMESLLPVWGPARATIADTLEGDVAGAIGNGALLASDLFVGGALVKGVGKGAVFLAKAGTKRAAPYGWKGNVRKWMGERGHLEKGQHGHHWMIPQNGWGKAVPDVIKNQPWNVKPMSSPTNHWRTEHRVGDLPRFKPAQRYWYGTPDWSKAATVSAVGRPASAAAKPRRDAR